MAVKIIYIFETYGINFELFSTIKKRLDQDIGQEYLEEICYILLQRLEHLTLYNEEIYFNIDLLNMFVMSEDFRKILLNLKRNPLIVGSNIKQNL